MVKLIRIGSLPRRALRIGRLVIRFDPLWKGPDKYALMRGGLVVTVRGKRLFARRVFWRLHWAS